VGASGYRTSAPLFFVLEYCHYNIGACWNTRTRGLPALDLYPRVGYGSGIHFMGRVGNWVVSSWVRVYPYPRLLFLLVIKRILI